MSLEKELEYYESHSGELLEHHEGSYVLIADDQLLGAFTTEAEAYAAGLRKVGNRPFLIRRVSREEETVYVPALTLGVLHARPQ
jgi:hypothetical protein